MNGFSLVISVNKDLESHELHKSLNTDSRRSYVDSRNMVKVFQNSKFENDQIFIQNKNQLLVLSGVVLNKKYICKNNSDWDTYFLSEFLEKGEDFLRTLRGSFCGFLLNLDNQQVQIFTDHLSTKQVFYFSNDDYIIASTKFPFILSAKEHFNLSKTLSEEGALSLLSYGYIMEDKTISKDVFKVPPGAVMQFNTLGIHKSIYYKLEIKSVKGRTDKELIEIIDNSFRKAIELQFEKDEEYGYLHLVGLSGGLDSRMTSLVAHEMGYKNQVNFTFSQSNYLDETIPKKIASDYKHEWLFKSLDNGLFLYDIDEISMISGGNILYYGLAHANSMFKCIDFSAFGLVHTGQLGDVVIGSILKSNNLAKAINQHGAYSSTLLNKKSIDKKNMDIGTAELNLFYQRGIYGANCGLITSQQYSETISPFYDIDFLEACFSIPLEDRLNHQIYKKWVCLKYPKAADYTWEKTGAKVSSTQVMITLKGNKLPLRKLLSIILNKYISPKIGASKSMNPLGYWYDTNSELRHFLDSYFEKHINLITDKKLKEKVHNLYSNGTAIEKNQVISLLSSIRLFFTNNKVN